LSMILPEGITAAAAKPSALPIMHCLVRGHAAASADGTGKYCMWIWERKEPSIMHSTALLAATIIQACIIAAILSHRQHVLCNVIGSWPSHDNHHFVVLVR